MNYLPLVLFVLVALGLFYFSTRARRRQAETEERLREDITLGSEVMTTSGLYGTVVAMNDDDSVQLSIAPGVEVKWTVAALRDVASLPDRYRTDQTAAESSPLAPDDIAGIPDLDKHIDPSEQRPRGESTG